MNKIDKFLVWLGFDVVIDVHPYGDLRVVQRGKKQIIQRLTDETYAGGGSWIDIKEIKL